MASGGEEPNYYEDVYGMFSIFDSDEEEPYDVEEPGFPPDLFEESDDDWEDPVPSTYYEQYEHTNESEQYKRAFDFIVSVDIEEETMDAPGFSSPLPEGDFSPCPSPLDLRLSQSEDRLDDEDYTVGEAISRLDAVGSQPSTHSDNLTAVAGPSGPVAGPSRPVVGRSSPVAGPSRLGAGPSRPVAGPSRPVAGPSGLVASRSSRDGHPRAGRGINGNGWQRGDRLVEKYPSNNDFPPSLAEEIARVEARHVRNTRRSGNVGRARERVSEEEALFYEIDQEEFKWEVMDGWHSEKERFLRDTVGPSRLFVDPYDAFRSFWDDDILSQIVEETNRYAEELKGMSARFARLWYNTNVHEILVLFAFWMMLGIIKMPSVKSCFSKLPLLKTDAFRYLFKEERYWLLNRALHFARGSQDPSDPENVLYPMGHILEHLLSKFQELYTPSQNICIDESLILWKGPLSIRQYIKTKTARYGIKTLNLCESSTGYLWIFLIYLGKRTTNSTLPSSTSTVLKLMAPLLDLGHVLYMDNWFNSPSLARFLKKRKTDCVGTLRACRKDVPASIQKVKLVEGEYMARQSGDVMVMAYHDRKRLNLLSTYHDTAQTRTVPKPGKESVYKPTLIIDYNRAMGGVDRLDQMLEPYLVERKQCIKWNRKLLKRFLNISIQNSRVLVEKSLGQSFQALVFRLKLVEQVANHHLPHVPVPPSVATAFSRRSHFPLGRLTERHFIQRIQKRHNGQHRVPRRNCVWCADRRGNQNSKTTYECAECRLPLCLDFCFREFHTIP